MSFLMSFLGSGQDTSGGSGGLSDFDLQALMNALFGSQQMMHNRYAQLGLGVPSGDPLQAALSGSNLHYAGAGTAERTDLENIANQFASAQGTIQTQQAGNPLAPGSPANLAAANQSSNFNQGVGAALGSQQGGTGTQTGTGTA